MANLKNIYNIPLSCSFWDTLAKIYLDKYQDKLLELASVLFLVPNRRSCQILNLAFVRQQGLKPAVLPQIVPIAEIDDDDLFFSSFDWQTCLPEEESVISKEERLFLFARMIMSKPNDFGLKQISLAQAVNLSLDLANLIDTACNLELSFDKLHDLVPEKYATHWQETLKLLKIITEFWPQILKDRHAIDLCDLKKKLLYQQALLWQKENSPRDIVAAGITASFPAIVNLLKIISDLPNGKIYFSGVDTHADDTYWLNVDESHPQFELKELLSLLELDRHKISSICESVDLPKEEFISEIMRPASVSDAWQKLSLKAHLHSAFEGMHLIETKTQRDEALSIALKMREILNQPEKTAALITYDRNLARRVAVELARFNIEIDDSAGLPLSLSPIGIFLRLIAEAAQDMSSDTKFISILKNPFTHFHHSTADFRKKAYDYELFLRQKNSTLSVTDDLSFIQEIKDKFIPLKELLQSSEVSLEDILKKHIELAEELACSNDTLGEIFLWRGDAGKTAVNLLTKLFNSASSLGKIAGRDYLPLFCELMSLESVRSSYGTHPRLSILGPIEAHLCRFDYVILGEINEGIWPKPAQADMWMSRPMKKDFGFNLPEKNIGIMAADLCGFLASPNVILTRAERVDGVPMKKSRWLLRLETVLRALGHDVEEIKDDNISLLAQKLDIPTDYLSISAPEPCPPVSARPRKLSASAVDLLISDPYAVYAKYILRLYPLDNLDVPPDQRDYGTLIHSVIEEFNNIYSRSLPSNALDILINLGEQHFNKAHLQSELKAFWWPKFVNTAIAFIAQDNRDNVLKINNEVTGEIEYQTARGNFKFTAKADRIDILKDGSISIIDYKTGKIPSKKQIMSGHALQLLLEGLIASKGCFENISSAPLNKLTYWHLGSEITPQNLLFIDPKENDVLDKCEDYLLKLISAFDFDTTPYHSHPTPKYVSKNRDYEHLARVKEWSVQESEGNDD